MRRSKENKGYFKNGVTDQVSKIKDNLNEDLDKIDYIINYSNKIKNSIVKVPTRNNLIKDTKDEETIGEFNKIWTINEMVNHYKAGHLVFPSSCQEETLWTLKQKQDYIISLFHQVSEIKTTLLLNNDKIMLQANLIKDHFLAFIGNQELVAIMEFHNNEFVVSTEIGDVCYERLIDDDKFFFLSLNINCEIIFNKQSLKTLSRNQLELFLEMDAMKTKQT